jgi:drug/metabolite transporter (DMT)-like permease
MGLAAIWGMAYLFTRSAVHAFGPVTLVALRAGIASLVLVPILATQGGLPLMRKHAGQFAVQGLFMTAVSFILLSWASLSLPAGIVAVLSATAPMFGAVVGWLFYGERIAALRRVGLLIGLIGVVVLMHDRMEFGADARRSTIVALAIAAGLGSSLIWGFAGHYTRVRQASIDPLAMTTGTMLASAIGLAPFAALESAGLWNIAAFSEAAPATAAQGLRAWLEVIALGMISSAFGMLVYFWLLRRIGTVPTMSVTFMTPVFAMIGGALYLAEPVSGTDMIGSAIVLVGVALSAGLGDRLRGRGSSQRAAH